MCTKRRSESVCSTYNNVGGCTLPGVYEPHISAGQSTIPHPESHRTEVCSDVHTVYPSKDVPHHATGVRRLHQRGPECTEGLLDAGRRAGTVQGLHPVPQKVTSMQA